MKLKIYSFFILLVFLFGVIIFYVPDKAKAQPTQTLEQIMEKMVLDKGIDKTKEKDKKMMESLASTIKKNHEELYNLFEKKNFSAMAKIYSERNAIIVTADNKKIQGMDNILEYFQIVFKNAVTVNFKTKKIFMTPLLGLKDMGDKTLDCAAYVINEIHIIKGSGKKQTNTNSLLNETYFHRRPCPWG